MSNKPNIPWTKEFKCAITITDAEGKILDMNDKAVETFAKYGGADLIDQNVLNCHSERSQGLLQKMMNTEATNAYTIEKNGQKKLIYQCPWYENNEFRGLVEISLPIPDSMPHFIRN